MLGVDVHTKGIRALARMLRDRGVEVVYVGEHNTPEAVVQTALDEDADVIGISFSTASYVDLIKDLTDARARAGGDQIEIIVGGLIHPADEDALKAMGVAGIFGPGTTIDGVMEFLDTLHGRPVA